MCVYVQSYQVSSTTFEVYSNLAGSWGASDLSAPEPFYGFSTTIGESEIIVGANVYVCANLDIWNSNQNSFYEMTPGERSNGLMINYQATNNGEIDIDVSVNVAYIEYVSCKFS